MITKEERTQGAVWSILVRFVKTLLLPKICIKNNAFVGFEKVENAKTFVSHLLSKHTFKI